MTDTYITYFPAAQATKSDIESYTTKGVVYSCLRRQISIYFHINNSDAMDLHPQNEGIECFLNIFFKEISRQTMN